MCFRNDIKDQVIFLPTKSESKLSIFSDYQRRLSLQPFYSSINKRMVYSPVSFAFKSNEKRRKSLTASTTCSPSMKHQSSGKKYHIKSSLCEKTPRVGCYLGKGGFGVVKVAKWKGKLFFIVFILIYF